ncbi:MAG: helix-turn-helix transcriptional regulator [Capsulimonadales bacterium]|nr:helix-turn-helix transcriptional regulator [Capsulimonadales bacterium]
MSDDKGLLRNNATILVLSVLRDGARHGYDIAREVERRSQNTLTFKHGTLYPVLHALEKDGLITSAWEQPTGERAKRVYQLTEAGSQELERCVATWETFARAMNRVIRLHPLGEERPSET